VPAGALMWWLTEDERAITRLVLRGGIFGLWTAWAFLRHGLSAPLQMEIHGRAPGWLKSILTRLGFAKSPI